ncbi:MAG: helix-turn-helix transcriptional regulator [Spirochaetales bacterium]|nr:helix-turn-helix transcriptional regulator [Spirochaetales bacterium]
MFLNINWQIFFLQSEKLFYKYSGGITILEAPGMLFIPPEKGIQLRAEKQTAGTHIILGSRIIDHLQERLRDTSIFSGRKAGIVFFPVPLKSLAIFTSLAGELMDEYRYKPNGYQDIILIKLTELCIRCLRLTGSVSGSADIGNAAAQIDSVIEYLKANCLQPVTLEHMANDLGYSPSYLSRFFKNKTGTCLFEYVNRLRIQNACMLLKQTGRSVTDIAYDSGYNNISFFNRSFKKIMLCTPQEYRRKMEG